jgi:hypothetical protein
MALSFGDGVSDLHSQEGLFILDTETRKLIGNVSLGGHPHHPRIARGRAYIAVGPADLVVLNAKSRAVIGQRVVGSGVHDAALHFPNE